MAQAKNDSRGFVSTPRREPSGGRRNAFLVRQQERLRELEQDRLDQSGKNYTSADNRDQTTCQVEEKEESQNKKVETITICPLSNVEFCGVCPVTLCPGNKPNLPHGCLFLWYGRTRLDKSDILFSFKVSERTFAHTIQQGQDRANMVLALFKILGHLRQTDTYDACEHCGVGRTTKRITGCETTPACQERQNLAAQVLKTSYLRFPEFRASVRDVYLLARKSTVLEQRAQALNANINELLGLDERTAKALLDIMPVA